MEIEQKDLTIMSFCLGTPRVYVVEVFIPKQGQPVVANAIRLQKPGGLDTWGLEVLPQRAWDMLCLIL